MKSRHFSDDALNSEFLIILIFSDVLTNITTYFVWMNNCLRQFIFVSINLLVCTMLHDVSNVFRMT